MTSINTLILDDERAARGELKTLLKSFPEIDVVGESDTINGTIELINKLHPDLLFLDIQLIGETGFDLFNKINIDFNIIFVTAFDQYALRAFEVNAVDYLLKPVRPERLISSVGRIIENRENKEALATKYQYNDLVYLRLSNKAARFVKISSIISIQSIGNYSRVVSTDGNSYLELRTLKKWEYELPTNHFIRIHRATIINIEFIRFTRKKGSNHSVELINDNIYEVSRGYSKKLKEMYK